MKRRHGGDGGRGNAALVGGRGRWDILGLRGTLGRELLGRGRALLRGAVDGKYARETIGA